MARLGAMTVSMLGVMALPAPGGASAAPPLTLPGITEYQIPTADAHPSNITVGPDNAMWFCERDGNKIGRVNTPPDPAQPTQGVTVTEYAIPAVSANTSVFCLGITTGPDGNLWFTERADNQIGRINPITGVITEYAVPTRGALPHGIIAGPGGKLWFTEIGASKIGRIDPFTGAIDEFRLPGAPGGPERLTVGPDGNVWVVLTTGNAIVKIDATTLAVTRFPVPTAKSNPHGIAVGSDNNLWFTEQDASKVARITPAGVITEYATPTHNSIPHQVGAGPDGKMWFTEYDKAAWIDPATADTAGADAFNEIPLPVGNSFPTGITAGPDGAMWTAVFYPNRIARIETTATPTTFGDEFGGFSHMSMPASAAVGPDANADGLKDLWIPEMMGNAVAVMSETGAVLHEYQMASPDTEPCIGVEGSDGNFWMTLQHANAIARITPGGVVTEFPIPTPNSRPHSIALGADGNVWFTEQAKATVARITPAGVITEFHTPSANSLPDSIVAGPDGNLWYIELLANKVARLSPFTLQGDDFLVPTLRSSPHGLTVGPAGSKTLWFTEEVSAFPEPKNIGKVQLGSSPAATPVITEYGLINFDGKPHQLVTGPDNMIWITEEADRVARLDPANPTASGLTEFPVGPINGFLTAPVSFAGKVWFVQSEIDMVGRVDPFNP